jgi:hypothetical protein
VIPRVIGEAAGHRPQGVVRMHDQWFGHQQRAHLLDLGAGVQDRLPWTTPTSIPLSSSAE